ncbi:MAG TPA: AraC family transcriptional regulator [Planctomycetota bacterium]
MRARPERISTSPAASFAVKRRRDRRFEFAWHFHPEIELTWIVRSRGRRFVGDSIEDYRDGDLVLLGPDLPHTWHSEPGLHEAVVVQFAPDFLGELPELRGLRALFDRAARGLAFGARTLKSVSKHLDGLEEVEGLPRLCALLATLERLAAARDVRPLSSRPFSEPRKADMERIDRVCRHLAERYAEDVSLAEAAGVAHLSVPAFCRFFKSRTGKTLVGYLTELRIGRACRLLMETERSVSDVGYASGFNNLSNFNRRFLALKGVPPRAYRARFRVQ